MKLKNTTEKSELSPSQKNSKPAAYKKWPAPGLIILVALFLIGYFSKNLYISATVNGQPIYRYTIIKELEKQSGKQLLEQKITEALVLNEASKQSVAITEEQLDQEIIKIEQQITSQGQDLDTLLTQNSITRETMRDQVKIQKLIETLSPQPKTPSDEEINAMVKSQADTFPDSMSEEDRKNAVKSQLTKQQQSQSIDDWLESLRNTADIKYLINY